MGILDVPKEERPQYVARLLGFFDGAPATWDDKLVYGILANVERAAESELAKCLDTVARERRRPGWQI